MLQPILSLRTNNFNDPKIIDKVTDLWAKALDILADHNGSIYGVYHNYDSNYKGDYDLSIAITTDETQDNAITLGHNIVSFLLLCINQVAFLKLGKQFGRWKKIVN